MYVCCVCVSVCPVCPVCLFVCLSVCLFVCLFVYVHVCCVWCVSVCVCVCVYVCVYVFMCLCVYVSDTDLRYYYCCRASGYRGFCIHEDGGEEMMTGGTVGFCVEVGRVIICVALAENYGLTTMHWRMFGMDVSGICGDVGCNSN